MVRKIGIYLIMGVIGLTLIGCLGLTENKAVNDIITLLKANVGQEVIMAHIADKGMTFELSTEDIVNLKKAGASDALLEYMIGTAKSDFPFTLNNEFIIDQPVVHKHLAIYPVFRKNPFTTADYITLDQAQSAHVIVITELTDASVPTVIIANTGNKPIYIMAGEIIIGGKQDRMVSFDVLIPAKKKIEVEVRCVEQGRWHGTSEKFMSGGAVGSKSVRSALQFKDQGEVWAEVSRKVEEIDVTTQSGTYGAILSSKEVENDSKPFIDVMNKGLGRDDMVGLIMALNGEVICVDIFANPKFFAKVKEKLLKAYILDAISTEQTSDKTPGKDEICAFFNELKTAQTRESKKYSENSNIQLETDRLLGNESRDKDGKLQHLNLYKQ